MSTQSLAVTTPRRQTMSLPALINALSTRDLTDPAAGPHALQVLIDDAAAALSNLWSCEVIVDRAHPIVTVDDNYDRLGYPRESIARDARHTRYVSETTMLRSHTSAGIPPLLHRIAESADKPERVLLVLPGMVYRRDSIDRIHTGTPHQLDLWLLQRDGRRPDHDDLYSMVSGLIDTLLPGWHWRWTSADHPYTCGGRQVDVIHGGEPVEVAECGLAHPVVLSRAGLASSTWSGLALGMGLDRALMLRKGIPDIRLLRSDDERIAGQMLDLAPYQEVSNLPVARRDISIATPSGTDGELLGDQVREALGPRADVIETVTILSRTPYEDVPEAGRARLGIQPGMENLLVRITLRPLDRTMTSAEANGLREEIYAAVHLP